MHLTRYLLAIPFVFGLAVAAVADPVQFDTARGAVRLDDVPTRIVALDVAAVDTLTAPGVMPVGGGGTALCRLPARWAGRGR